MNDNQQIQQQGSQGIAAADQIPHDIIASLVLNGDLSKLNNEQKVDYYNKFCSSLGLNPLTQPFEIINLNGKLKMYAKKDATEQLRRIYGVSIDGMNHNFVNDMCIVTVTGKDKSGRSDTATGVVSIKGLQGENLSNAIMKAESKSKRRFTLSICGLGMLDEIEIDSIPANQKTQQQDPHPNNVNIDLIDPTNPGHINSFNEVMGLFNRFATEEDLPKVLSDGTFDIMHQAQDFYAKFQEGALQIEFANRMGKYLKDELNKLKPQQ